MKKISERLRQQLDFVLEIDQLKDVYRQNLILDGSRRENDTEHSWHIAVMAIIFKEYAVEPVDLEKVLKMLLLHDLVEIDAGDTFCYDEQAGQDKQEREIKAADRLYGLLPAEMGAELQGLWLEFEEQQTAEARFAACLDRLQPFLNNYHIRGGTWQMHPVTSEQVRRRMAPVQAICPELGEYVGRLIEDAVQKGFLAK
ncbi:MAG TPA: HD domain-containing protein [Firmicutes bacterium]|nr:HD domain-containing protein [Bacillota bacterium]